jgi:hypothetical protein
VIRAAGVGTILSAILTRAKEAIDLQTRHRSRRDASV